MKESDATRIINSLVESMVEDWMDDADKAEFRELILASPAAKELILEFKADGFTMSTGFDEWWDGNEAQYTADSCHMSDYHMAKTVWEAAFNMGKEA